MDAALVSGWTSLCQELAPAFTAPTIVTMLHLLTGWVMCRGRATVTNFICTIGASLLGHPAKHWTVYSKLFYRASWEPQDVSRLLLQRVAEPLLADQACDGGGGDDGMVVDLLIDDTTANRTGDHVACAGYFKDASIGTARAKVVRWAHNWVIGVVALRPARWAGWWMGLPILASLYRKLPDCDRDHPFQTRQELAAQMIHQTHVALPHRRVRVKADGQYATKEVAGACFAVGGLLISRLRSDSALYALPPKHAGPRKRRGQRLPSPKQMSQGNCGGRWRTVYVMRHGKRVRRRVKSRVCLWWHVAKQHPIKMVIVKNPTGDGRDDYLFSTDTTMSEQQIIEGYAARWPVEEAIRDAKQHDGLEQTQGWCEHTVLRQAPMALFKQTLVKAWYTRCAATLEQRACGRRPAAPLAALARRPWQREKDHPSYHQMLAALRQTLWQTRLSHFNSGPRGKVEAILQPLVYALCAAA
jgi:hypothetical protein